MSPLTRTVESQLDWWSQTGSNRRPPECKSGALPTELWPRKAMQPIVGSFERDGSEEHLSVLQNLFCVIRNGYIRSRYLVSKIRSTYLSGEG